jgi:hypothetical protein
MLNLHITKSDINKMIVVTYSPTQSVHFLLLHSVARCPVVYWLSLDSTGRCRTWGSRITTPKQMDLVAPGNVGRSVFDLIIKNYSKHQ